MKITLAFALLLFMLYLAGCDFLAVSPELSADQIQLQESVEPAPDDLHVGTMHAISQDTTGGGQ